MDIDEALKIIKEETTKLKKTLKEKKVPILDISLNEDSIDLCEPFASLDIELDEGWFYEEIEKAEKKLNDKEVI